MAQHRAIDAQGNDKVGQAAISMWWLAHAAAEETLTGSPLTSSWLKLFRTHLSTKDQYWLRWRGDLAESTELRRAFSGLYGRFFARALLNHHLGFTCFCSLKRNGLNILDTIKVVRTSGGDIPDWIAWDERNSRPVLCEAKGSLTARDFLSANIPKCVATGKKQFYRVRTSVLGETIYPAEWVAATRWATDVRNGNPITMLCDPPVEDEPLDEEKIKVCREILTRAWINSIAKGMGWSDANDLMSKEREREALLIRAEPGPIPEVEDWPHYEDEPDEDIQEESLMEVDHHHEEDSKEQDSNGSIGELSDSNLYTDTSILLPPKHESSAHESPYIAALVTRFGIRPVNPSEDFDTLLYAQESARNLVEPSMLVGIPLNINSSSKVNEDTWLDKAGIVIPGNLAVFDIRGVEINQLR